MPACHIDDARRRCLAFLNDPKLLDRRPPSPSLRTRQNRNLAHVCSFACKSIGKLSQAKLPPGRRSSPEGYGHPNLPPSDAEELVIAAWASGIQSVADFKNIVLCELVPNVIDGTRFDALCTALCCGTILLHPRIVSYVDTRDNLIIASNSRFVLKKQASYPDLLKGALLETAVKWRFLQFYRIFEQGYLDVIFEKLSKDFGLSPKSALASAQQSVESEYQQLVA